MSRCRLGIRCWPASRVDGPKGAIKSTATDQVRTVRLECELVAVGPMTEDEAASVATFGDLRRFEVIEGGVDPGR
jgi:hypothetical protein